MGKNYDFSGWATRSNVRCSDGLTIKPNAFKDCDGKTVPLVWNHQHHDPNNVLGHALLKNVDGDVFAYCSFNDSESGKAAKILVEHGDISSMSILANQLTKNGSDVVHGIIREVSLVLAGANPKAFIEEVVAHGDGSDLTATMYFDEPLSLEHGEIEEEKEEDGEADEKPEEETISHAEETGTEAKTETKSEEAKSEESKKESDDSESKDTLDDIIKTLNDKQYDAVCGLVASALEASEETKEKVNEESKEETDDTTEGGNESMKHNIFETKDGQKQDVLSHDAITTIIGDAKRFGSMKESVLQHADTYGINQIDYLVPEAKSLNTPPEFIQRDMGWVSEVMGSVHHTPFSRIKSVFADITEDEARAKGYMKGKLKKEEVFGLLKRSTIPTTIYKKQKMDRDDVVDITDFDVIAWLKSEMRKMLDEEIARAILVGDGRLASSDDKISEQNIRPVWKDEELYTIKSVITLASSATADDKATAFIRAAIKARKDYKGSGNPTLFTTEDFLTDMLLLTDTTGRDLYDSIDKLTKKLRVSKIVTVPVMEGLTSTDGNTLMGIIVNLADYNVGADKGGAINMFEDFDIDYNQQKYLIETRCSGALIKPHSAIALELKISG